MCIKEITLTCTYETLLFLVPLLQNRYYSLWKKRPHSCIYKRNLNLWCEKETSIFNIQKRYESLMWHATCNTLQHTATHCNTLQHTAIMNKHNTWEVTAMCGKAMHHTYMPHIEKQRKSFVGVQHIELCTLYLACVSHTHTHTHTHTHIHSFMLNECVRVWVFVCVWINMFVCVNMSVCMCVRVYVCVHVCMWRRRALHAVPRLCVCHISVCMCVCVCVYICLYVCVCVYACMCVCMCACKDVELCTLYLACV